VLTRADFCPIELGNQDPRTKVLVSPIRYGQYLSTASALGPLITSRGQRTLTATTINRPTTTTTANTLPISPSSAPGPVDPVRHLFKVQRETVLPGSNCCFPLELSLSLILLQTEAWWCDEKTQHCALDRFFVPGHLRDVRVSDAAAAFTQCTRPQTPVPHAVGRPFEWLAGK
jgi:hypothetical protein